MGFFKFEAKESVIDVTMTSISLLFSLFLLLSPPFPSVMLTVFLEKFSPSEGEKEAGSGGDGVKGGGWRNEFSKDGFKDIRKP